MADPAAVHKLDEPVGASVRAGNVASGGMYHLLNTMLIFLSCYEVVV